MNEAPKWGRKSKPTPLQLALMGKGVIRSFKPVTGRPLTKPDSSK